jgi:hypothetical protein
LSKARSAKTRIIDLDAEREKRGGREPRFLTVEAIAADPWNAVELPLPPEASRELLNAAKSAAEYSAEGAHCLMLAERVGGYVPKAFHEVFDEAGEIMSGALEYNEANWIKAEVRISEINERLAASPAL